MAGSRNDGTTTESTRINAGVEPRHVRMGDAVVVERRYVVDGALTSVSDEGRFQGVQLLGSTEHLVLENGEDGNVRMIPMHTVSEIKLQGRTGSTAAPDFDPGFA